MFDVLFTMEPGLNSHKEQDSGIFQGGAFSFLLRFFENLLVILLQETTTSSLHSLRHI